MLEVLDLFERMTWQKDAYIYFFVTETNLLRITHERDDIFIIEITDDKEDIASYYRKVKSDECVKIIEKAFERQVLDSDLLDGFEREVYKSEEELSKNYKNLQYKIIAFLIVIVLIFIIVYNFFN